MVSAESARERVRTVTEVLMSSAEEQQLPEATCTGPGGGQTAMDRLLSTVPLSSQQWLWIPARLMRQWRPKKSRPTIFFAGCYPNLTIFAVRA